jgi:hypothetical protein
VVYDDGDEEDYDLQELRKIMLPKSATRDRPKKARRAPANGLHQKRGGRALTPRCVPCQQRAAVPRDIEYQDCAHCCREMRFIVRCPEYDNATMHLGCARERLYGPTDPY